MPDVPPSARRRTRQRPAATPDAVATDPPATARAPDPRPRADEPRRRGRTGAPAGERGLRDLAGAGHSQVSVSAALRARDLNRPTEQDLAAADEQVVIVRRHWRPPPAP